MTKQYLLTLSLTALLAAGCGAPAMPLAAAVERFGSQAVVADSGQHGGKTIAIDIAAPTESGFHTLAIVHKWVDADIFEYKAALMAWNGSTYAAFATPIEVTVPRKGVTPKTKAVFTNLKHGAKYQVALTAWGDNGGTAATTSLNTLTPTTAIFDFTAIQDVEDSLSETMQITFDPTAFSGTGTATVATPEDGTYESPTAPENGAAE